MKKIIILFTAFCASVGLCVFRPDKAMDNAEAIYQEQGQMLTQSIALPYVQAAFASSTTSGVDPQEVELLAITIYSEGGGDDVCDECRYRIGDVVLNRIADGRYPNTMLDVLTQKRQYGSFFWTGVIWPERASLPQEKDAVDRARKAAYELLSDTRHSDLYGQEYIYQAEHEQGTGVVKHCGIYFGR